MRTDKQWIEYCRTKIAFGYTPNGTGADFFQLGQSLANLLQEWDVYKQHDTIVDVGCGSGRLAMGLLDKGITQYYGLDVIPACIKFATEAFKDYKRFHFYHLDVKNAAYYPQGKQDASKVVYPLGDVLADVVVANSLFSHTETLEIAERNLSEMRRILKPGGKLFSTWRLVPPLSEVDSSARHTNYLRGDALQMLDDTGFEIVAEFEGLPKEINSPKEQAGFLCVKR